MNNNNKEFYIIISEISCYKVSSSFEADVYEKKDETDFRAVPD